MARTFTPNPFALLLALPVVATALGCGGVPDEVSSGSPDASPPGANADANDGAGSISAVRMMADVEALASESFAGRAPGTPGGALALAYVESLFDELDLDPAGDDDSFRQNFAFEQWREVEPPALSFGADALAANSDHTLFGGSGSGTASAEVVFAGYGLTIPAYSREDYPGCPVDEEGYDDYQGLDVTDKIVLLLRHGPNDVEAVHESCPANSAAASLPALWNFGFKAANAKLHGAAAMLMVQDYRHDAEIFYGSISDWYYDASFPALVVDRDLVEGYVPDLETWATALDEQEAPNGHSTGVTATLDVATEKLDVDTANLIGILPGTDPALRHEVVVIGAHVDHVGTDASTGDIFPGADDNASGTAVMMELARVARETGLEPARTVLFASFNAEETGLNGSCHLVGNSPYPMEDVVAMVSVDMVGAGNGTGLILYGAQDEQDAWLATLMERSATEAALPYGVVAGEELMASDHACFSMAGVTAVLAMTLGDHVHYHTPQDTADTILPEDLETAASLLWVTLRALAAGEEQG